MLHFSFSANGQVSNLKADFLANLATDLAGGESASCESARVHTPSVVNACSASDSSLLAESSWMPGVGLSEKAFHDAHTAGVPEQGGRLLEVAKAAFLSKDPAKTTDPLAYRVLMILPTLYISQMTDTPPG